MKYCLILEAIILLFLTCPVSAFEIDSAIRDLQGRDLQKQIAAVEVLGRAKEEKAVSALLEFVFVKAEDWKAKIKAIRLLGEVPDPAVADRLVTLFNDPFSNEECPAMKWNTAMALGQEFNKGARAVKTLIEALQYNNSLIREAAAQSLGRIGDTDAVIPLTEALQDRSLAVRLSAVKALEQIGDPRGIPALRAMASSESDQDVKTAILKAIGTLALKE